MHHDEILSDSAERQRRALSIMHRLAAGRA
jgi:hypothetical protein